MRISYKWLQQFIDVDYSPEDIADILTNTGLEVEQVTSYSTIEGDLGGLVVGEIIKVYDHPNADKLQLTEVEIGENKPVKIVCGAPNVREGQKVVVAPPQTTLYPIEGKSFTVEKATIRGEVSEGMICAEDEIGIGHDHSGVIELEDQAQPGESVNKYFDVYQDVILEFDITPNRPDALSHRGVARDLKAYLQVCEDPSVTLQDPPRDNLESGNASQPVNVKVEDTEACPRYAGITISGLTVEESPTWLKNRLDSIDIRPVNNIVDITNFVLWELGQPLHAFDCSPIKDNEVIVRHMLSGTSFTTLEGEEISLSEEDLMITDPDKPLCMAGVIGGENTGVTKATKEIFLESAYFSPSSIRKSSQRHSIKTDAADHFEKGGDPEMVIPALQRAVYLIKSLAGGTISGSLVDIYDKPVHWSTVTLNKSYVDTLIGQPLPADKIKQILEALEIEVKQENADIFQLRIPPYRSDVTRPADVVEEILRIHGYNQVAYSDQLSYSIHDDQQERQEEQVQEAIADYLAHNGFYEMMNTSLINSDYLSDWKEVAPPGVPLQNYSSEELDILRPTLLFSGLEMLHYNQNRQQENVKSFEFGKTYQERADKYQEYKGLSLFMTGQRHLPHWKGQSAVDFFQLKGYIENVLQQLSLPDYEIHLNEDRTTFDYGLDYYKNEKPLLHFGAVNMQLVEEFELKDEVFYAYFYWEYLMELYKATSVTYTPVSPYPQVHRDLSLLLDKEVPFLDILQLAYQQAGDLLQDVQLFDVYEGENIADGKKSYAVRFVLLDKTETLTEERVTKVMQSLVKIFRDKLNASIR